MTFDMPVEIAVFEASEPLAGARANLCVRETDCSGRNLLDTLTTDSKGFGTFAVTPQTYLSRNDYVPPFSIRVDATPTTYPHRFEGNHPLLPFANRLGVAAISFETPHGNSHFVYGVAFDCRGTLMMAARGVDLVPSWLTNLVFYWPEEPVPPGQLPPINTGTTLTGVFSTFLPASADGGADSGVPAGRYHLEIQDHESREVRARYDLQLDRDENIYLSLFPFTKE